MFVNETHLMEGRVPGELEILVVDLVDARTFAKPLSDILNSAKAVESMSLSSALYTDDCSKRTRK